jgi:hypothetical protein
MKMDATQNKCPAGTKENIPQFQLRDKIESDQSPAGAAEIGKMFSAVPSGLGFLSSVFPPLKRRAIFGSSLRDFCAACFPRISDSTMQRFNHLTIQHFRLCKSPHF